MATEENLLDLRLNELPALSSGTVCYLVGAGLSAASIYEVPTAVGFFSREFSKHCADKVARIKLPGRDPDLAPLLDRIENEYGPLDRLNLETVMTDLYVRAFGIARSWETYDYVGPLSRAIPELRRDYGLLIHYISERLPWLNRRSRVCEKLKTLVDLIRAEDSVVTLNYDTTLEYHFDVGKRESGNHLNHLASSLAAPWTRLDSAAAPVFSLQVPTQKRGVLTKLHGSKDWYTCPNEVCPNRHHIHPWSDWFRGAESSSADDETVPQCTQCGSSRRMVIIPPTASKAFEEFPKLGVMWAQSYEAFRWAERWVFMGVSLAQTDFHLSSFLRSLSRDAMGEIHTSSRQVCIVNPDPELVAQRLVDSLGPKPANAFSAGHVPIYVFDSVEEFLKKARESDQRKRRTKARRAEPRAGTHVHHAST